MTAPIVGIMFKEAFRALDLNAMGVAALIIFVAVFVAIAIWAMRRPCDDVQHWSKLPFADDANNVSRTEARS